MKLDWTGPARADLRAIDAYLADYSRETAARILEAIVAAASILLSCPSIGPSLDKRVRSLRVRHSPYILLYRLQDDAIEILRIHHVRQDWRPE